MFTTRSSGAMEKRCRRVRETNDGPRSDVREDIEEAQRYDDAFTTT